jgi:hypothetical protein
VGFFHAGNLSATQRGDAGDEGVNEGELLAAEVGGRKIGGVFDAKGVGGFAGGNDAVDFLLHNNSIYVR